MRVAVVLSHPRSYEDGITRYADGLVKALIAKFSVEVVIVAPGRLSPGPRRHLLQLLMGFEQLVQLLAARPDVVHVHEHPVALAAGVAYRLMRLGAPRLIFTEHVQPVNPRPRWRRLILGRLLACCTSVTCVSAESAGRLGKIAEPTPQRIEVIHSATSLEPRAPDDPEVLQFRRQLRLEGGPILCQIGLNYPLKVAGILRLLEALALIRPKFPGLHLLLVGRDIYGASIAATCERLSLSGAVTLTGHVRDISLPLSLADVYCHITLQDASPLSVLEAMSCGRPIVAARTGGIPEILRDRMNALLVDPEVDHIAAAIESLLSDAKLARSLAACAQQTARAQFSWGVMADQFAPLFGLSSTSC